MSDPALIQAAIRSYERATDLQYVQLLLAILLVILLLYFVGCYYGAIPNTRSPMTRAVKTTSAEGAGSEGAAKTGGVAGAVPTKTPPEHFAPYASILTPDIERSDAQFDRSARTVTPLAYGQRSSENLLFNGIHATQLLTPLY